MGGKGSKRSISVFASKGASQSKSKQSLSSPRTIGD